MQPLEAPSESPSGAPWYRKLHWQIALGVVAALAYGLAVRLIWPLPALEPGPAGASAPELLAHATQTAQSRAQILGIWGRAAAPFAFLGDLFIRALKMIIIPLIVSSVVCGIQGIGDASALGKIGLRTLLYYLGTTFLAVCGGLLVVNLLDPGAGLDLSYQVGESLEPTPISQVFAEIVPTNALAVFAGNDMLPSIFVAVLTGLGLLVIGEEGAPVARFFEGLEALVLKITDWIMATAPIGVGALFIKTLLDPNLADLGQFFADLGSYMIAVLAGLGLHALVTLPILLFVFTGRKPWEFARSMSAALLTSFSTASSSATYPVTLECVTEEAGVSQKSANFVLPLGATINMDGTALYEAVAAIFIANALGVELSFGQQVVIVITATLAAIGAAGVPSAGLVTMIIVLESVGLPGAAYGLVVAVDRLLDMCRTSVNVWGDSVGAAIVSRWVDLEPAPASPSSSGGVSRPGHQILCVLDPWRVHTYCTGFGARPGP